ncbi:MAG: hypothetical protein J3Q66DRAFT_410106 [Benniella sp.]|nr:MAG: hypothetical protein J3Q66DRAFT_410106 [Benniella sp.]
MGKSKYPSLVMLTIQLALMILILSGSGDDTQTGVPKDSIVVCIVTTIDGEPALQAIQKFTDRASGYSKDPGVRLNDALASTSWSEEWSINPVGFARRWEVPNKGTMEYKIKCGSKSSRKITVPWIIKPTRLRNSMACVAVNVSEDTNGFDTDPAAYLDFIEGLESCEMVDAQKLILDMTDNGGGLVGFAYFINKLFFPEAKPYFVQDQRANTYIQGAAKIAVKHATSTIFDIRIFIRIATGETFKDASMYTKEQHFAMDMAIVTNGWSGSACTMIATCFNIVHKVKTYAGGLRKAPLSYFSFPGGYVMDNDALVQNIEALNYKAKGGFSPLPVRSSLNVAVGKIYAAEQATVPLEYDSKYFAANIHLEQDSVSARHPDNIWVRIAKDF